jgi:hypothetical protein
MVASKAGGMEQLLHRITADISSWEIFFSFLTINVMNVNLSLVKFPDKSTCMTRRAMFLNQQSAAKFMPVRIL